MMSTPDVNEACHSPRTGLAVLSILCFLSGAAFAQPSRIPGRIDPNRRAVLRGFTTPRALPELDRGAVEPSIRLSSLSLMLNRTAAQQADLERFLEDQLSPSSPDYHNWLTPERFADRFSLSADDFEKVTAWLTSDGFAVDYAGRARNWILFSGSAAQVESTFQTPMRRYLFDGEMRYANAREPSVPDAIAPLIGYLSLNDFPMTGKKPRPRPVVRFEAAFGTPTTNLTDGSHVVTPGDLATIYNVNPLYQMGLDGSGIKMAIVGVSDIHISDMQDFRTQFGLPQNDPQVILVEGSTDPGYNDGEGEADLDLQYAGGLAPKATLLYVKSTDSVNSALYAVQQNLAPIISMSFQACEQLISSQPLQFADAYRQLAQQANAQGITWMVSSGDAGAAACDMGGVKLAVNGLDVNVLASVPEVTGVGGTMFNEGNGNYWSPTGNSDYSSVLSYIPEAAWNDTATMGTIWASGGGASTSYSKPSWQTGAGVPNDQARDVPDVSLSASGHDAYFVMTQGKFGGVMGTSAACPSFAGMVALLNQYLLSTGKITKPGLSNINPNLYHLAAVNPGVYHDVTVGTNIVPCTTGTKDCTTGQIGYRAGPGYDLVTGLGSVDAYKLITGWNATSVTSTTTTVSASPGAITTNSTTTLTATVTAAGGTPGGQVTFAVGSVTLGAVTLAGSGATATGSLTVAGSRLPVGTSTITGFYGGGSGFNGSSGTVNVTVSIPTAGSAAIASVVPTPVYQQAADADGYSWFYTIRLSEIGGVATTLTAFSIDSTDYTGNIESWFGSSTLPAHGTLSASLRTKGLTKLPVNRVCTFKGVDGSGAQWTQQISVPFMAQQIAASMLVTSSPATVAPTPTAGSGCDSGYDFYQVLNLQERNGYEVQLTKFVAGGFDLTDSIPDWFGSWRLAPLGTLQADICWSLDTVPDTIDYQIEGVDTAGHKITATASISFNPAPAQSGGALSSSVKSVNLAVSTGQSASATLGVVIAAGQQWSATLFPANQKSSWLVVSPQSGTGPATITLAASAAGLANGVYTATLVLQSVNTLPQFVNVPIAFTIGGSSSVVISGISNTFSGGAAFAPGMLLTVYGTNLAGSTQPEAGSPLPTRLAGVSASINGAGAAVLRVAGPGQPPDPLRSSGGSGHSRD